MVGEGDTSFWEPLGDVALAIVVVANPRAAAKARDVLQDLPMGDGVAVGRLDPRAGLLGERGKLSRRHDFQQVAVGGALLERARRDRSHPYQRTARHDHASPRRQEPQELSALDPLRAHSSCFVWSVASPRAYHFPSYSLWSVVDPRHHNSSSYFLEVSVVRAPQAMVTRVIMPPSMCMGL